MIRSALLTALFTLSFISVHAQDSRDIQQMHGKRENVYSVSEKLWMTPSYDKDGQVCLMRLYPKLVSETTNYLDAKLNIDEALKFINQSFPVNTRGRRSDGFGMSDLGGQVIWTRFEYEHVRFVFISTFRLTKMPEDLGESVLLDFPANDEAADEEYRRKEQMKTDDQLMRERTANPQVVEIYWPNRKCLEAK